MNTTLQQFDALQHYVPLRAMIPTIGSGEYVRADEARKIIAQQEADIEALKDRIKQRAHLLARSFTDSVESDLEPLAVEAVDFSAKSLKLQEEAMRLKALEWHHSPNGAGATAPGVNHLYIITRTAAGKIRLEIHKDGHYAGHIERTTMAACVAQAQEHHREEIAKFFETSTPGTENPPA